MKRIVFALMLVFAFTLKAQDEVDMLHYIIVLDVDNTVSNSHIGYTGIECKVLQAQEGYVDFMLKDQNVDSVIDSKSGTTLNYSYSSPYLSIYPAQYGVGDTLCLRIYYRGGQVVESSASAWGGMHYSPNIIYNLGVAFNDYPHSYARSWFVAKDEFDDKATYDLKISVRQDRQAICGGRLTSVEQGPSCNTYNYTIDRQVAPYLVSLTIADFSQYENTIHSSFGQDIPLSVHYLPIHSAQTVENMFSLVPLAFDTLEKSFGKYAFDRVGYCVTPKGSMEHVENISLAQGVLTNEIDGMSNIVHELAHAWFGNNITCSTQEDMWINEGWTSFTTRLSLEAIYGEKQTRDYFRDKHQEVISSVARQEGYIPLYPVDSTLTYGSTVYDKGSMVALSLKEYIGDSLFFASVRDLLTQYRFDNISSYELRDYLSERSGKDLNSFFDNMVFSSSTPHYEIGSCEFTDNGASVTLLQRAYPDAEKTLAHSRIPITFYDGNFNSCKKYLEFDGQSATIEIGDLPLVPVSAMLDMDEEFMDLTTDYAQMVKTSDSIYELPNTYFKVKTNTLQDSVLVRATLHWIGEQENDLPYGVSRISSKHYWTIEGVNLENANLQGMFYNEVSSLSTSFDNSLARNTTQRDSLMILYRRDKLSAWSVVPTEPIVNNKSYVKTAFLVPGEYVFAVGDSLLAGVNEGESAKKKIRIYPNPVKDNCIVESALTEARAELYDLQGRLLKAMRIEKGCNKLDLSLYKDNLFLIKVFSDTTSRLASMVLVRQ